MHENESQTMKKYKEIAVYSLFDNFQIVQAEFAAGFHVIIGASVTKAIVESSLHQLSALLTLVSLENISQIYAMLQYAKLYTQCIYALCYLLNHRVVIQDKACSHVAWSHFCYRFCLF